MRAVKVPLECSAGAGVEPHSDFRTDHGATIKRCVRSSQGLDNVEKAEMALSYTPARHEW